MWWQASGVMVKAWSDAAVHRHAARADRAVGALGHGDRVGVDREAGGDGVVRAHAGEGVARHRPHRRAVHQHVVDVPARVGRDGEGLVVAVARAHRSRRADRAVQARAGGDRVGVDREAGGDRVTRAHVVEGVAGHRTHRAAVDDHVVDVVTGHRGDREGLARSAVHAGGTRRRDRAVATRRWR